MSIQRNDWSLQRKGIIDQDRHKERVKEAIRKNLGSMFRTRRSFFQTASAP
jgi:uncharacterized sporulation protein YeaH/YhbH (DUF444 family)